MGFPTQPTMLLSTLLVLDAKCNGAFVGRIQERVRREYTKTFGAIKIMGILLEQDLAFAGLPRVHSWFHLAFARKHVRVSSKKWPAAADPRRFHESNPAACRANERPTELRQIFCAFARVDATETSPICSKNHDPLTFDASQILDLKDKGCAPPHGSRGPGLILERTYHAETSAFWDEGPFTSEAPQISGLRASTG